MPQTYHLGMVCTTQRNGDDLGMVQMAVAFRHQTPKKSKNESTSNVNLRRITVRVPKKWLRQMLNIYQRPSPDVPHSCLPWKPALASQLGDPGPFCWLLAASLLEDGQSATQNHVRRVLSEAVAGVAGGFLTNIFETYQLNSKFILVHHFLISRFQDVVAQLIRQNNKTHIQDFSEIKPYERSPKTITDKITNKSHSDQNPAGSLPFFPLFFCFLPLLGLRTPWASCWHKSSPVGRPAEQPGVVLRIRYIWSTLW